MALMKVLPGTLADQGPHPWQGPDFGGVAALLRPLQQSFNHFLLLLSTQTGLGPSWAAAAQRGLATLLPCHLPGVCRLAFDAQLARYF